MSMRHLLHQVFENSTVFNLNQIVLDGGKETPVREFLADIPSESVVDLGCGPGNWAHLTQGRYLGIDSSDSFIESCRRSFANEPRKRFIKGDISRLDIDDSFDLAVMMSVLHHLSDTQALRTAAWAADHAEHLFVMDLFPVPENPISRQLYRLDRGEYIRAADRQEHLLAKEGPFRLVKKGSFYSWNRLYRHTMFLLKPEA